MRRPDELASARRNSIEVGHGQAADALLSQQAIEYLYNVLVQRSSRDHMRAIEDALEALTELRRIVLEKAGK